DSTARHVPHGCAQMKEGSKSQGMLSLYGFKWGVGVHSIVPASPRSSSKIGGVAQVSMRPGGTGFAGSASVKGRRGGARHAPQWLVPRAVLSARGVGRRTAPRR